MAAPSFNTLFVTAVNRAFESWTVLQLAVSHGFGGAESQEKAKWMVYAVDQWFHENKGIETYEAEDFLADILNNEFDTLVDDGSLPQMATLICDLYRLCSAGKETEVMEKLQKLPRAAVQQCARAASDEEELQDDDVSMETGGGNMNHQQETQGSSGDVPASNVQNNTENDKMDMEEEAEDGWTVVRKGKKR